MTAPRTQPPLGVESKTLPSRSMMAMCVVSLRADSSSAAWSIGPSLVASRPRYPIRPFIDVGVERERVARPQLARSLFHVDELRALTCVFLGEQTFCRYPHELGVRVVAVAIRVGELHGFDEHMEVVSGVVSHGLQVEGLEQVQRFEAAPVLGC